MSKVFIQFYLTYLVVSAGMLLVYKFIAGEVEPEIIFAFCSIAVFVVGKSFFDRTAKR